MCYPCICKYFRIKICLSQHALLNRLFIYFKFVARSYVASFYLGWKYTRHKGYKLTAIGINKCNQTSAHTVLLPWKYVLRCLMSLRYIRWWPTPNRLPYKIMFILYLLRFFLYHNWCHSLHLREIVRWCFARNISEYFLTKLKSLTRKRNT